MKGLVLKLPKTNKTEASPTLSESSTLMAGPRPVPVKANAERRRSSLFDLKRFGSMRKSSKDVPLVSGSEKEAPVLEKVVV